MRTSGRHAVDGRQSSRRRLLRPPRLPRERRIHAAVLLSLPDSVLVLDDAGPQLGSYESATDLIGQTFATPIETVVIPVSRLDPDFFVLRTGVAGEFVQKFVNYRRRLVIVGDVSAQVTASEPLGDWVRESNRRDDLWFVADLAQLEARLAH